MRKKIKFVRVKMKGKMKITFYSINLSKVEINILHEFILSKNEFSFLLKTNQAKFIFAIYINVLRKKEYSFFPNKKLK